VGASVIGATKVAWRFIDKDELSLEHSSRAWLTNELRRRFAGRADLPCFLTARRLDHFEESVAKVDGFRVRVVATVGLSNALAAGDSPAEVAADRRAVAAVGTINILVLADRPVSAEARLEALAIATEAKALALFEAGVKSRVSVGTPRPATGTGTDCVLVAAPAGQGPRESQLIISAGKHTAFGSAVGTAVLEATSSGIATWLKTFGRRERR
jgi:adenosylcobinamide amidohydrolase